MKGKISAAVELKGGGATLLEGYYSDAPGKAASQTFEVTCINLPLWCSPQTHHYWRQQALGLLASRRPTRLQEEHCQNVLMNRYRKISP